MGQRPARILESATPQCSAGKELHDEAFGDVLAAASEHAAGLRDDRASGTIIVAAGELNGQFLQH